MYSFKAVTVVTGIEFILPNFPTASLRAIVPSSFVTSPIQATGGSIPARTQRVTDASVCPDLSLRRPGFAMRGNICPGRDNSFGVVSFFARSWKVSARSEAETPVETSEASHVTVKAVPCLSALSFTIRGSSKCFACSFVIGAHNIPDVCRIIFAACLSEQNRAAITRSPSFSRDASSITSTIPPVLMVSITVSIGDRRVSESQG
mmetsp:Transcript_22384/g.30779  ORF Transcript_22384/g.30779 Transcript_22384/m.30779 type:complete len:205 (+) Transcript_22384:1372-1986(+)